jgi:hypothetical protein
MKAIGSFKSPLKRLHAIFITEWLDSYSADRWQFVFPPPPPMSPVSRWGPVSCVSYCGESAVVLRIEETGCVKVTTGHGGCVAIDVTVSVVFRVAIETRSWKHKRSYQKHIPVTLFHMVFHMDCDEPCLTARKLVMCYNTGRQHRDAVKYISTKQFAINICTHYWQRIKESKGFEYTHRKYSRFKPKCFKACKSCLH